MKRKVKVIHPDAEFRPYRGVRTMIGAGGYILEFVPQHPGASPRGWVHQHRLVVEKRLGRYLSGVEVVHHINKVRTDNRDENLQVFPNHTEHLRFHQQSASKIMNPLLVAAMRPLAADPNVSIKQAATRLGMSYYTVYNLCKRHNIRWIAADEIHLTAAQVRQALRGRTTLEAAAILGCSHQTLRRNFDHLLTKRKSPSHWRKGQDASRDVPANLATS